MKYYAFIALFFFVIAFAFWLEYNVWTECRQTNSFFYCMRILNK